MENQLRRSERAMKGPNETRFGREAPKDATTDLSEAVLVCVVKCKLQLAQAELLRAELETTEKLDKDNLRGET